MYIILHEITIKEKHRVLVRLTATQNRITFTLDLFVIRPLGWEIISACYQETRLQPSAASPVDEIVQRLCAVADVYTISTGFTVSVMN